jgi:hypothetical protein
MTRPEVFISYKWNDFSEQQAEMIEDALIKQGFQVIRDKSTVEYKSLISEFAQKMGKGKYVVCIISDAYLKSVNCLREILLLYQNKDFKERIFPVILDDALIRDESSLNYIKYWEKRRTNLENHIKNLESFSYLGNYGERIDFMSDIRRLLQAILFDLNDMSTFDVQENNYAKLVDKIVHQYTAENQPQIDLKIDTPVKKHSFDTINPSALLKGMNELTNLLENPVQQEQNIQTLYELQSKIFDPLFTQFKRKLNSDVGKKSQFIEVLFNRIVDYNLITELDKYYIQSIRTSETYSWYERSSLVSALTIALLNKFDPSKVSLLIDFSINSEEKVWQKAFVGVVLSTILHRNKLSNFPHLEKSLERIIDSRKHQKALSIIDYILRNKLYSIKETLSHFTNEEVFQLIEKFMPSEFYETIELEADIALNLSFLRVAYADTKVGKVFNHLNQEKLKKDFLNGKRETSVYEILVHYSNFKDLVIENEINLLLIPKENINTFNWFTPFLKEHESLQEFRLNVPDTIENGLKFLTALEQSNELTSIDKYYLSYTIAAQSEESIFYSKLVQNILSYEKEINVFYDNAEFASFGTIISEIYRFTRHSKMNEKGAKIFPTQSNIQENQSLSNVINTSFIKRVKGFEHFDSQNWEAAEKELEAFFNFDNHDVMVIDVLVDTKMALRKELDAISLLKKRIDITPKNKYEAIFTTLSEILPIQIKHTLIDDAFETIQKMEHLEVYINRESIEYGQFLIGKADAYEMVKDHSISKLIHMHFETYSFFLNHKKDYSEVFEFVQLEILYNYQRIETELDDFFKEQKELFQFINRDPNRQSFSKKLRSLVKFHEEFGFKIIHKPLEERTNIETNMIAFFDLVENIASDKKSKSKQKQLYYTTSIYSNHECIFETTVSLHEILTKEPIYWYYYYLFRVIEQVISLNNFDLVSENFQYDEEHNLQLDMKHVEKVYAHFEEKIEKLLENVVIKLEPSSRK